MTKKEIAVSLLPSVNNTIYTDRIYNLFSLIKELSKESDFSFTASEPISNKDMLNNLPELNYHELSQKVHSQWAYEIIQKQNSLKRIYESFDNFIKVQIKFDKKEYKFDLPCNAKITTYAMELLGIENKPTTEYLQSIVVDLEFCKQVSKAVNFIAHKKDTGRDKFKNVWVLIRENKIQINGTDCSVMYVSRELNCRSSNNYSILISEDAAKKIGKIKKSNLPINIVDKSTAEIDGNICQIVEPDFILDYKCLIPEYAESVILDSKKLSTCLNTAIKYSNKVTKRIDMTFSEKITITGSDMDLDTEFSTSFSGFITTLPNFEYSINGSYLIKAISALNTDAVRICQDGSKNKVMLVTNDLDKVLIMPYFN